MTDETGDELLGRAAEEEALAGALGRARAGRGQLVVLSGEAGIGKSALLVACGERAARQGFAVAEGRAWEAWEAPAWAPVQPWLRALALAAPAQADAAASFAFFQDVLAAVAGASARRPTLWIVDDAHAADVGTIDLLLFLSRPIEALPAVILLAVRDDRLAERNPMVAGRLARIRRAALELKLAPLGDDHVAALAARVAGAALEPRAAAELCRRTGGNPLFVVECARSLAAGGRELSSTVQEVVRDRVAPLRPRCREILRCAAILGRELHAGVLGAMLGELPATVIDELEVARRRGILEEVAPGRFRFAHAVVGEALLGEVAASARADMHARAATALSILGDAPAIRAERAQHVLAAASLGGPFSPDDRLLVDEAIRWLDESGAPDRAFALDAQRREAQATGLLPAVTVEELIASSRLAVRAGSFQAARRLSLAAFDLAVRSGHAPLLAEAALAVGADTTAAKLDRVLIDVLERALAALPEDAGPQRVHVCARLAAARQPAPEPNAPVALARAAIEQARALGDEAVLHDALYYGGAALTDYVDDAELRVVAEELLAIAVRRRDRARALRARGRLALACGALGDFAAFDRAIDQAEVEGRGAPPALRWRALLLVSMRAFARGALVESERLTVEVERLGQLTDDPALASSLAAHRLQRDSVVGPAEAVRASTAGILASIDGLGIGRTVAAIVRGIVFARVGDRAAAAAEHAQLPPDLFEGHRLLRGFWNVGEVYAAVGTDAQRRAGLEALAPRVGRHLFSGHVPLTYEGPMSRVVGLLAASLRRWPEAIARLRDAVEECARVGFRTWEARARFELAEVLAGAGAGVEAEAEWRRARALCDELGACGLLERFGEAARGVAAQAGAGRQEPSAAAPRASGEAPPAPLLCARDGETWVLAWSGRTVRMTPSRGIEMVARLVERAGEEVHVLTLASDAEQALADSSAGEALDARAVKEYRRRLDEIARELGLARLRGGPRREALEQEKGWLEREVARGTGLQGRRRAVGSLAERARVNVQRRIKDALARVAELDPALGAHLRQAIRTGTYCTYRP